jgi:hypothetical protein
MNKRMIQLFLQAGGETDYTGAYFMRHGSYVEKFAELIVRECMTVARKADGLDAEYEAWYLIKEHFGVEE